jgi:hypothetical protein
MFLVIHIVAALSSLAVASYLYASPSRRRFYATYATTVTMLVSGFYLVIANHASLVRACITGLFFLGVVSALVIAAHKKITETQ